MNKVGILTFTWGYNPGTLLQAYSVLSLMAHALPHSTVELINYQPKAVRPRILWNVFKPRAGMRVIRYAQMTAAFNRFRVRDLGLSRKALRTKDYGQALTFLDRKYDAIIVGSDQVWEVTPDDTKVPVHFPNCYWLGPRVCQRKVAFSASAGASEADRLTEKRRTEIKALVKDFDLISVRDEVTEDFLRDCAGIPKESLIRLPDPTFGLDFPDTNIEDKLRRSGLDLNRPIVAVGLSNRYGLCKRIIDFLTAQNYQVIALYPNVTHPKAFVSPAIHPFEWASLFKHVVLTVTDRFHASVFSLKHLVPFVAIDLSSHRLTSTGNSKVACLVREFALPPRHCLHALQLQDDPTLLFEAIDATRESFDRQHVKIRLSEMKKRIQAFTKSAARVVQR